MKNDEFRGEQKGLCVVGTEGKTAGEWAEDQLDKCEEGFSDSGEPAAEGKIKRKIEEEYDEEEYGEYGEYGEEEYDEEGYDEDLESVKRPGYIKRVVAFLVIVAFLALSVPFVPDIFSKNINFLLDQSGVLREDEIVQKCKPAVVSIEAVVTNDFFSTEVKRGTGFNISPIGKIITNQHIVEKAGSITVRFGDGRVYHAKQEKGAPNVDMAVLQLEGDAERADLPSLELNLEQHVQIGETVTIIGNPLGLEKISQRGEVDQFYRMGDSASLVFDINIPVHPGNSGSPVLDNRARVVGVVYASGNVEVEGGGLEVRALAIPIQALLLLE